MQIIKSFIAALLALSLIATSGNACARFVSVDPVQADANSGENFNRYYYGNNNPYKFVDPDGSLRAPTNTSTCAPGVAAANGGC